MSSKSNLDEGIKSIKSAWQREHTARANLEKMLENAEVENEKLRGLVRDMWACIDHGAGWNCDACPRHEKCRDETGKYGGGIFELECRMRELGIEVTP